MKMCLQEDIVSLTDFARQTRQHIAELQAHNRPRVLTHNGKAAAVVLSVAAYEEMAQAAEERRLDLELKTAIEAYARGERGTPGPQAFEEIRAGIAKRKASK
jgi:PHD/YefM family antitoxin component YafN of YafNO toxin-antitoxin module